MNRRAFVVSGAAVIPMLALGKASADKSTAARPFVVSAGKGRAEKSLRLFDRSWIDFKVMPADTGGEFFMIEQRDLLRFGPPRHVHHHQDEWFRPIEGTYRVEVGSDKYEIGPGDLLFAPRGIPHVWAHLEDKPGGMLVAWSPAGKMEEYFYGFTKFAQMPATDDLRQLFRDHGMEIVGPPLEV